VVAYLIVRNKYFDKKINHSEQEDWRGGSLASPEGNRSSTLELLVVDRIVSDND
jgi:hypothetical protein